MAKAERNCVVTKSDRAPSESDDQPPNESDMPPITPTTAAMMPVAVRPIVH